MTSSIYFYFSLLAILDPEMSNIFDFSVFLLAEAADTPHSDPCHPVCVSETWMSPQTLSPSWCCVFVMLRVFQETEIQFSHHRQDEYLLCSLHIVSTILLSSPLQQETWWLWKRKKISVLVLNAIECYHHKLQLEGVLQKCNFNSIRGALKNVWHLSNSPWPPGNGLKGLIIWHKLFSFNLKATLINNLL